uniref:Uncharacterized protein n=1 Tax=Rhizophora mucronata TaxID=61149 RepID=A0A2P2NNJ0_RHIMU
MRCPSPLISSTAHRLPHRRNNIHLFFWSIINKK